MTEAISGLIQQSLQEAVKQSAANQQAQAPNGKLFEEVLTQDPKADQTDQKISGTGIQAKLEALQTNLERQSYPSKSDSNPGKIPSELLETGSRKGLLREAFQGLDSAKASAGGETGFRGQFKWIADKYDEVEGIMSSDKNLSPGELLALQARLYQVSQHIEVMSKVVDQMAGGIKTVLNTNL